MRTFAAFVFATAVLFGQGSSFPPDPNWRTVGAGPLASRPATCVAHRSVYLCTGNGCVSGNRIYYCIATNTWEAQGTAGGVGIASLNGLTDATQSFAIGTSGTDFSISSAATTHTFNLPSASASNRGLLTAADWATFNGKVDASVTTLSALSSIGTITTGVWHGTVIGTTYGGLGAALNAAPAHATLISNGATPAVFGASVISDCVDSAGNHLNYTQSTDAFSCGTSVSADLGTPTTLVLTHATSLPLSGMANIAAHSIPGNNTGASGPVTALSASQVNTMLGTVTTSTACGGDLSGTMPNCTVASIGGKTVSLSGNFSTTGAFSAVFAIPSSSTWTFPTAGGTLLVNNGSAANLTNLPITLTTTGTSNAATYTQATNTLNIPVYQGALTLTTTGSSGPATLVGNTLNIPQYTGGGGGSLTCELSGAGGFTCSTLNFGTGFTLTNSGGGVALPSLDTGFALTIAAAQSGAPLYCNSITGNTNYTCSLSAARTLSTYTIGQVFVLNVDTTCSSSCNVNIDTLGQVNIKNPDGSTDPGGALIANQPQWITLQSSGGGCSPPTLTHCVFELMGSSSGGGGMVYPPAGIAVSTGSAWGTSLTAPTGNLVGTGQANTYSTGLQDFSAANTKLPAASNFAATSANNIGYDTTNTNVHIWDGADGIVAPFASAPTNGHNVTVAVVSGKVTLTDGGALGTAAAANTASACTGNNWSQGWTSGSNNCAQLAFSNLSGSATASQLPANQVLRHVGATLTPGATTACVPVDFTGTINSFQMSTGDGGTAGTVTVKVQTVALSSYTGVGSTSDISNGGETMTTVAEKRDTTLTSWSTSVTGVTEFCFVASGFASINSVNANVSIAAN